MPHIITSSQTFSRPALPLSSYVFTIYWSGVEAQQVPHDMTLSYLPVWPPPCPPANLIFFIDLFLQGKKTKIRLLVKRNYEDRKRESLVQQKKQSMVEEKEQRVDIFSSDFFSISAFLNQLSMRRFETKSKTVIAKDRMQLDEPMTTRRSSAGKTRIGKLSHGFHCESVSGRRFAKP